MQKIDISIIIATRNREQILKKSVAKACKVIAQKNVEIIVVNDGEAFLPDDIPDGIAIQYLDNQQKGVSAARNLGVRHSKGEILFFVDDDMWISKQAISWIKHTLLVNTPANAVYNMNWIYPPSLSEKLNDSKIGRYILRSGYNTMWGRMHEKGKPPAAGLYAFNVIASCSLVMKKEVFDKIGGYNEKVVFQGEDIDLANKIRSFAIPIFCVFDVTLYHNQQDRLEIGGFLSRLSTGYGSEFKAVQAGLIQPHSNRIYRGLGKIIFEIFRLTDKLWIGLYKLIPNRPFFKPVTNRLIGLLAGLERYKEWRKVYKGKK